MIPNNLTPLPAWAEDLKARYEAGTSAVFLLYGNVRDYFGNSGEYHLLVPFLHRALLGAGPGGNQRLVVTYSFSGGLGCPTPEMEQQLLQFVNVYRGVQTGPSALPAVELGRITDPTVVLPLLERLIATRNNVAVIIEDVEALTPSMDVGLNQPHVTHCLMTLRRWAADPLLDRKDCIILLVTESLSDVHSKIQSSSSRLEIVKVPLPVREERLDYIRGFLKSFDWPNALGELTDTRLAELTGGLTLEQLDDLLRSARYRKEPLSFKSVIDEKKRLIEKTVGDLAEVVEGGPGLEVVGGMEQQKQLLNRIVEDIKAGRTRRIPKGIYMQGAPGTGKTFLMTAFGSSSGLVTVVLKSFYNKYVGGTESNVERLLGILEAMGPLLLILDEYDQTFGRRGSGDEGDSGVRQRVWAMFSAFLSRPDLQGFVIPVALLNRSDLVDAASKRAGRFDLRLPLFLPDADQQIRILERAFRNNQITPPEGDWTTVRERLAGKNYSPADLNKIAQLTDQHAGLEDRQIVTMDDVLFVMDDYVPSGEEDPETIEYMELLAARSSTSKAFLPDRYRQMLDDGSLDARLHELRLILTSRGVL